MAPSLRAALPVLALGVAACGSSGGSSSYAPGTCPADVDKSDVPALGGSGALEAVTSFGENPAGLSMFVHAPRGATAKGVVVALHGCTQRAADYVAAGWNEVADREGLVVVYAEQPTTNNTMRCFRWWEATQASSTGAEARSIAAMARHAKATYGASRAFVTGLSAGGAMAVAMLSAYPDLFEAGAIMAGLPYGCATSQLDAFSCMSGPDKSAEEWTSLLSDAARAAPPRISIWQGDADYTVRPANRAQLVRQWTRAHGIGEEPSAVATEGRAVHEVHRDASGVVRVESWELGGMGHGVAVDAKGGCGKIGAFALDVGVCSSQKAAAFFLGTDAPPGSGGAGPGAPDPCD